MGNYVMSLKKIIEAAKSDPNLVVTRAYIAPPVSGSVEKVEAQFGITIDPSIRLFYSQCNGCQLAWVDRRGPGFDDYDESDLKCVDGPDVHEGGLFREQWINEEDGAAFVIYPIEDVFQPVWGQNLVDLDGGFEQSDEVLLSFMYFEAIYEACATALSITERNPDGTMSVFHLVEQGSEIEAKGYSFESYMLMRLNELREKVGLE